MAPLLDTLGAITPNRIKGGKKGSIFSYKLSWNDSGTVKFCTEVDLNKAKLPHLQQTNAILGEKTRIEVGFDFSSGRGELALQGDHTVLTGKLRAATMAPKMVSS